MLEFHGRKDRQVKARGYRIELDEVEAVLGSHEAVESAAAFAVPDEDGSLHVEGAVTVRDGHTLTLTTLRQHLTAALPRYAIPERMEILDAMPRTSTGKIDRRVLAQRREPAP